MLDLAALVGGQALFRGMSAHRLHALAACAQSRMFAPGSWLLREGEAADAFFVLLRGHVVLELVTPGRAARSIATLGPGDVAGVSWVAPPYRWQFDARALEPTLVLAFDVACLRATFAVDAALGLDLMQRFAAMLAQRLQSARLHMLDVYGDH